MSSEDSANRRVRFYGAGDLATYWQAGRAAEIAGRFDPADAPTSAADIIELHNVRQYVEAGFFPSGYTDAQRAHAHARVPGMRSVVARFFTAIDDTNAGQLVAGSNDQNLWMALGRVNVKERTFPRMI